MSEPTHTPEPWSTNGYEITAEPEAGGLFTLVLRAETPRGPGQKQARKRLAADLDWIVACVNACAALEAELARLREHYASLARDYEDAVRENDDLRRQLQDATDAYERVNAAWIKALTRVADLEGRDLSEVVAEVKAREASRERDPADWPEEHRGQARCEATRAQVRLWSRCELWAGHEGPHRVGHDAWDEAPLHSPAGFVAECPACPRCHGSGKA